MWRCPDLHTPKNDNIRWGYHLLGNLIVLLHRNGYLFITFPYTQLRTCYVVTLEYTVSIINEKTLLNGRLDSWKFGMS